MQDLVRGGEDKLRVLGLFQVIGEFFHGNVCGPGQLGRDALRDAHGDPLLLLLQRVLEQITMDDLAEPALRVAEVVGALPQTLFRVQHEPVHQLLVGGGQLNKFGHVGSLRGGFRPP